MKTIEQKAKRYDEAIEIAKEINNEQRAQPFNVMTRVFPELAESEDERIRKYLIDVVNDYCKGSEHDGCIAWLEKQAEHKPTIFIPKFHVGDKLVSTKNPRLTYKVLEVGHINELGNPEYKVEIFTDGKASNPHNIHYMECYKVDEWAKLIEQKPDDKVELSIFRDKLLELFQKFRWRCKDQIPTNGDILKYVDAHVQELIDTMQKTADKVEPKKEDTSELTPFEAELFSMMSDAWQGYLFGEEVNIAKIVKEHSSELLERANEQKPAEWSEEDEAVLDALIQRLEGEDIYVSPHLAIKCLKSIKDRINL